MSKTQLVPTRTDIHRPSARTSLGALLRASRPGRALATIEDCTVVRSAAVQGEGFVEAEKLRELDRLAHTAMNGQALLRGWANHLAGDDLGTIDDLRFFTDLAKLGKGEIIADAIDTFRRQ